MIRSLILSLANLWSALWMKITGSRSRHRWLELDIHGVLPESAGGFDLMSMLTRRGPSGPGFMDLLSVLRAASRDEQLDTVLIRIGRLDCGFARTQEIAAALSEVRESGKHIVVAAEQLGLKEYLLACEASRVVLSPQGHLTITGMGSDVTFLRGALDRLGIEPQLLHRGDYKSASDLVTEKEIREPHRRMLEELLEDLYRQTLSAIAARRNRTIEDIRALFDRGPFLAPDARSSGLVDDLGFLQDERDAIRKTGEEPGSDAKQGGITFRKYLRIASIRARRELKHPDGIALLHVTGTITSGEGVQDAREARSTGSRSFVRAVETIAKNRHIKALVLRVNSPGGSGLASDVMLHALRRLEIPVVVSMGDTAASGGYYVAADSRFRVYASPGTITGSIGVISGKLAVAGLYEKLGLGHAHVGVGKNSNYFSTHTPWTPEQLRKTSDDIDAFYRDFVDLVAGARSKSFDDTHAVAQGRVWSGAQAKGHGLVDELGGLRSAILTAQRLAKLPEGPVRLFSRFQKRPRIPFRLAVDFPDEPVASILTELKSWELLAGDRVLALMPWKIRIY